MRQHAFIQTILRTDDELVFAVRHIGTPIEKMVGAVPIDMAACMVNFESIWILNLIRNINDAGSIGDGSALENSGTVLAEAVKKEQHGPGRASHWVGPGNYVRVAYLALPIQQGAVFVIPVVTVQKGGVKVESPHRRIEEILFNLLQAEVRIGPTLPGIVM